MYMPAPPIPAITFKVMGKRLAYCLEHREAFAHGKSYPANNKSILASKQYRSASILVRVNDGINKPERES